MFSTDEFIRQYQNLSNPDKIISNQANQYILKLQQSNDSFQIAKQLLDQPNLSNEYLFIACQLIYRRLKEECDITIQPYLLQLLQRDLPEIARNQVCSSFAVIIIGNKQLWQGVLNELIQLMKVKMNVGIEILTQIAIQGKEWYKKSEQMRLQQEFANQEDTLSEIFLSLLNIQDLNIINQSIYCIECWIQFSYNLFKQQLLIQQLLSLTQQALNNNKIDFSDSIFNLLIEGVIFSQYNRVQSLEQQIIQNLTFILEFILKTYHPQLTKVQASFITKFISDFYIIISINKMEQQTITLMTNIITNPSRKIAFSTFDFWSYLREHNQLQGYGLNILQTMIDKCRMKTIKLTKEFLQGEPEEEDADYNVKYYEGGNHFMSTSDFREHSKDIFYSIYKSAEQAQQNDQYFQIVLQNLKLQSQDAYDQIIQCESAIFSLCSIIDEADIQINNQIIMQIIQFILQLPKHPNFDIIVKTSLQMFTEFTMQLNLNVQVLLSITRYFFNYMLHPLLGPLAGAAFEQISGLSALNDQTLVLESIIFLETHFIEFISQSQLNNYIEGLIKLCTRLYTNGNIDLLIRLLTFANNQFQQIKNSITEKEFNYCNTLVIAILSWINLNIEDAHQQIIQLSYLLCSSIIEPLLSLLQNQSKILNYDELYKLFKIIIKVINYNNQQEQILKLLEFSLQVFQLDPIQKFYWLSLITNAISRASEHQFLSQWAQGNGQQLHIFCIEQFQCWKDPDLMKIYVEYVKECIRFCPQVLFDSLYLNSIIDCICEAYCTLNSYEMQREILHFFKTLIQHLDNTKEYFSRIVLKVGQIIFLTISDLNPALIFQIESILQFILQKQVTQQDLTELIYQALLQGWGKGKPINHVKLVSHAIVILASKTQIGTLNRELKLLMQNLRPLGEEEINYMQLEMVIKRK